MIKIYKLVHPKMGVVYIGKTKCSLSRRKSAAYKNNAELQAIYKDCDIVLIEETNDINREAYWIDHYGIDNLLNIKRGNINDEAVSKIRSREWANRYYQNNYQHIKDEYNRKRRERRALKNKDAN